MKPAYYEYKIGTGKMPVLISFLMAAVFGGGALWLRKTENPAFLFMVLIFAFAFIAFLLSVYRFAVYKVLIAIDGFYYQTHIGNGRFYRYTEVKKAWSSSGQAQNGVEQNYCNVSLKNGSVLRFLFYETDEEAIEYLIRMADAFQGKTVPTEQETYRIDGKYLGASRMIGVFSIVAVMVFLDTIFVKVIGGKVFLWILIPSILMGALLCLYMVVNYRSFRVQIEKDGFYCRTNPFNGKYYAYSDIASCREIRRVKKNHNPGGPSYTFYYYFFEFTDVQGETRRFFFEKSIYEREINVLQERIRRAKPRSGKGKA